MRSPKPTRPRKRRILIVGEGRETEFNYFLSVRQSVKDNYTITVKKPRSSDAVSVVQAAIDEVKQSEVPYEKVWCVVDVDNKESKIEEARQRIRKSKVKIELCLSNPCFEVWFLAHFDRTDRPFNGCNPLKSEMSRHWKPIFGQEYRENTVGVFERLAGKLPTAMENTKSFLSDEECALDKNSSTEVYRIMESLGLPSSEKPQGHRT